MTNARICAWAGLLFGLLPLAGAAADKSQAGQVTVQWLGHAAFKLTSVTGKVIVIDPFVTGNPKLPDGLKVSPSSARST